MFPKRDVVLGILLWKEGAAGLELFRGNPGRATWCGAGIFIPGGGRVWLQFLKVRLVTIFEGASGYNFQGASGSKL